METRSSVLKGLLGRLKKLFFITLVKVSVLAPAQTKDLSFPDFYNIVLNHHPIVKQAQLLDDLARQEIRLARGKFDPKLEYAITSKTYDGKKYFEYVDYELKVPTWIGGDLKFGYENNSGINKNPFDYTPPGGLLFAGYEISINDVLFDDRRALVRQAQVLKNLNAAERVKIINKVLLTATKNYWEWFYCYHRYKIKEEAFKVALETFKAVKGRIEGGDFAGIDSVEAKMNLQERNVELIDSQNDLQKASFDLSLDLWTSEGLPLEVTNGSKPEEMADQVFVADTVLDHFVASAMSSHPELMKIQYKLQKAEIDKKLYFQGLIPNLTAQLKYLSSPNTFGFEDLNIPYFKNNYKVGVFLEQPLFLRKERAKFQMSNLKISQTKLEQRYVLKEVENNVRQAHNDMNNYFMLLDLQKQMYLSASKMYDAERTKFEMGEATLFYLNVRQTKQLESNIKLYSYYAKLKKSEAYLYWVSGIMKF